MRSENKISSTGSCGLVLMFCEVLGSWGDRTWLEEVVQWGVLWEAVSLHGPFYHSCSLLPSPTPALSTRLVAWATYSHLHDVSSFSSLCPRLDGQKLPTPWIKMNDSSLSVFYSRSFVTVVREVILILKQFSSLFMSVTRVTVTVI